MVSWLCLEAGVFALQAKHHWKPSVWFSLTGLDCRCWSLCCCQCCASLWFLHMRLQVGVEFVLAVVHLPFSQPGRWRIRILSPWWWFSIIRFQWSRDVMIISLERKQYVAILLDITAQEVMFSPGSVSLFIYLSAGSWKKHWTDLHQTWCRDGA